MLIVDLDGFKAINDTRGHSAGDEVLRESAELLAGALRAGDRLFRLGGDEFATVVQVGSPDELAALAARLVEATRRTGRTVSVGGALLRTHEQADAAGRRADAQLYRAKRQGREQAWL